MPKLSKRDLRLLDDYTLAAQDTYWQNDQGCGSAVSRAEIEYEEQRKRMERRLARRHTDKSGPALKRLARIAEIIESVDNRAMAADGPVTPTLQEMTRAEISEIYFLTLTTKTTT